MGPVIAVLLWLLTNKTKIGKISRAAAVDREMVGAVGINVSWVFAITFVIGCFLAGLGGALVAPIVNVTLGMDASLIMEAFLIVIMGGLGNIWGALLGALIFGLTQSLGILVWPQFGVVFPYAAVIVVLTVQTERTAQGDMVERSDSVMSGRMSPKIVDIQSLRSSRSSSLFPLGMPRFYIYMVALIITTGLLSTSMNLVLGFGGIYQFHHAVFYGVGAYGAAVMIAKLGYPPGSAS